MNNEHLLFLTVFKVCCFDRQPIFHTLSIYYKNSKNLQDGKTIYTMHVTLESTKAPIYHCVCSAARKSYTNMQNTLTKYKILHSHATSIHLLFCILSTFLQDCQINIRSCQITEYEILDVSHFRAEGPCCARQWLLLLGEWAKQVEILRGLLVVPQSSLLFESVKT